MYKEIDEMKKIAKKHDAAKNLGLFVLSLILAVLTVIVVNI